MRTNAAETGPSRPPYATVPEELGDRIAQSFDDIAIVFEETQLTYGELDDLASRIAGVLRETGVEPGDAVGLCIERCPEAIASMLAVFKIGASFVPLDPEYPIDRIRYMIRDASIRVILAMDTESNPIAIKLAASAELDPRDTTHPRWIACNRNSLQGRIRIVKPHAPGADDLAYIMYTSGSTGMPKGVQIEHRALATYCRADREIYRLTSSDRTLQFSTLNFDIAIEEIFPPLLAGGTVVIRPQERSATHNELSWIIDRHRVTAIHIATAYWHEWVDLMMATQCSVPQTLRLVIATGEKVSVEHYRRWQSICKHPVLWCNAYGPTETTVTATVFIPDDRFVDTQMPIGKPLSGYEAYILDERYRPLGIGQTGQLFIGGPALARGYLNRPEKNAEAFLMVDLHDRGPTRLYRTGDLARWNSEGDIEYAGRIDHQMKIGSYRIEPGEIEAAIAKFPSVLESLVVAHERDGQKYLIAYVADGEKEIDLKALQGFLRESLPHYMVPSRFMRLSSLPKTMNGKIDRQALPALMESKSSISQDNSHADLAQRMRHLWKSVLDCDDIRPDDDFFALGGSSLLVTRVVAALVKDYRIELPVRDFFANPTLRSITAHVEHLLGKKTPMDGSSDSGTSLSRSALALPCVHAMMIPCRRERLFAVHYEPRDSRFNHAVLMCNSIAHEQTRAHRNLQQLALQLAHRGLHVLRFDYEGTGNSTGSSTLFHPEAFLDNVRTAAHYLRHATGLAGVSLLGIRMGAFLGVQAGIEGVRQLILWDPVIDGESFLRRLQAFHRETLTNQSRFARRIARTETPQLGGWQVNDQTISAIRSLKIDPSKLSEIHTTIVASRSYLQYEPGLHAGLQRDLPCRVVFTDDAIAWDLLDCTERAFSSPESYRAIADQLTQGLSVPGAPWIESSGFSSGCHVPQGVV